MPAPNFIARAIDASIWSWFAYGKPVQFASGLTTLDGYCGLIDATYEWVSGRPKVDVDCLVVHLADRVIFAFRGTDDIRGWLVDANVKFVRTLGGWKAHAGFYGTVDAIYPQLKEIALKAIDEGKLIYDYGHSKGGAESCQFAIRFNNDPDAMKRKTGIKERISFGEPRSLNRAGAKVYNAMRVPTYRVIDQEDIVCRIPLRLGLFRHVNTSAFIDEWLNITFGEPWFAHIGSDIYGAIRELLRRKVAAIEDHGMGLYYQRLKAIQEIQNNL